MTPTPDDLLARLERWRDESRASVASLNGLRQRAEESSSRLESPHAIFEFIDFFSGFFTEVAATLDRVRNELEQGPQLPHAEALRQIASNAALEQRRGLKFRDKWINRPLPYEDVRPLLTEISNHTGQRLTSFREMTQAAAELDTLIGPVQPAGDDGRALDRRALFTKWFGR
jgi:hypothetical protein